MSLRKFKSMMFGHFRFEMEGFGLLEFGLGLVSQNANRCGGT